MGMFDDLVPQQQAPPQGAPVAAAPSGGGMFDDLVPKAAQSVIHGTAPIGGYFSDTAREFNAGTQAASEGAGAAWQALKDPHSPAGGVAFAKGVGNAAMGGVQALSAPLTAAINPAAEALEGKTGIPAPLTEFAATMMLPTPKKLPSADTLTKIGDIVKAAKEGYESLKASKVSYAPEHTAALADYVSATLNQKGAYPHLADNVHKTVDILRKDTPSSIDELRSVQEALSTLKVDADPKMRRAANIASGEIAQFIGRTEPELAKTLETANANYAATKRAEDIQQASEIAGLRAGRAGYGGNAVNNMRQVLSPIAESAIKGNPKGFNPEEIQAVRGIVEGSTATNALRGIGQLSPSKGIVATGLAGATLGGSALVGAAANKLASVMTSRQIDNLKELVLSRAPAAQRVANPMRDWLAASQKFTLAPTPPNLARLTVASRNFQLNLTAAGIPVDHKALVQSGMAADPEASDQ